MSDREHSVSSVLVFSPWAISFRFLAVPPHTTLCSIGPHHDLTRKSLVLPRPVSESPDEEHGTGELERMRVGKEGKKALHEDAVPAYALSFICATRTRPG